MDLTDLPKRVAEATGPDRYLDGAIGRIIGDYEWADDEDALFDDSIPYYTSSIDATLGLVEILLPGWTIAQMGQQDDKSWYVELREGFRTSYNRVAASNYEYGYRPASLPLAILAALLSALSPSESQK